jgi:signal transduction histidine kinase
MIWQGAYVGAVVPPPATTLLNAPQYLTGKTLGVVTDRLSLEQVIGNLFDNAVKYRAKERPLRLQVSSFALPDGQIAIEVADNGRGVAPHDVSRIFELFRRVGKLDQTGEGVGLAYARTVIRNVGGDITATSELDKGTTFRIVLPRELALNSSTIGSVLA